MIELLAPGGSPEGMRAALAAGADAIYMGGTKFGARAYAVNAGEADLMEAIDTCHLHGAKLYLTVNTLLRGDELEGQLYDFLAPLCAHGLDAVLVQDLGVLRFIRREFPHLPVHASTQMTLTGADGARLLYREGAERIVPSRELSLAEIRHIHESCPIEIECFVHGALCYCYSGQCLMSSMIGGRSGNRGRCAQPCRLPYRTEGEKPSYLMSLKDICTLEILPDMLEAGVCSLKIEGRMKRPEYAAGVTAVYRKYLDLLADKGREGYAVREEDVRTLQDLYCRGGFSTGYAKTHNGTGTERHIQRLPHPVFLRRCGGSHVTQSSYVHAEETGKNREQRTTQVQDTGGRVDGEGQCQEQHDDDDGHELVLSLQERERTLPDEP